MRCLGTWTDKVHAPLTIGVKEPLADQRISDGVCDRCCKMMDVRILCRWCQRIETVGGICEPCEMRLSRKIGAPSLELTVYRFDASKMWGNYDGAGAMLRLRGAMKEPEYCGFELHAIAGVRA